MKRDVPQMDRLCNSPAPRKQTGPVGGNLGRSGHVFRNRKIIPRSFPPSHTPPANWLAGSFLRFFVTTNGDLFTFVCDRLRPPTSSPPSLLC